MKIKDKSSKQTFGNVNAANPNFMLEYLSPF